ncbi:hypothetical protein KAR26_02620 [Candidatus Parcubacteria bacterium]|nr:hypothetical protein [Candidatus Parcubacteria bacterium]
MYQEEKEIDLIDYIKIILKRKLLIFVVFLIFIIIAGVATSSLPRPYKIDTSLEIGKITEKIGLVERREVILENPEQLAQKIKGDVYGILAREELNISERDYPEIEVNNPENTDLIVLKIKSTEVQKAKNILEEINRLILEEHQQIAGKKVEVAGVEIESTKVIKPPTISEDPTSPKFLLNIILAGSLGIFMGVFLAFSKEWWDKNKDK